MKILLVTPNSIDHSAGGTIRTSHIRDALLRLGQVHTVVFQHGVREYREKDSGEYAISQARYTRSGFSIESLRQRRRLRQWIGELIDEHRFDFIVVCFLSTTLLVPRSEWNRVIADADDAFKSLPMDGSATLIRRLALFVRNAFTFLLAGRVAHVWYVNARDGERLPTSEKSILQNVITMPDIGRQRALPVRQRIVMVGLIEHPPNEQGLRWFVKEVMPPLVAEFPDLELHVIGRTRSGFGDDFDGEHVKIRGFVKDLTTEYDSAELVVAPIFFGGGTQIKVIDAMAHGRPLVASDFAHSGFISNLRATEHLCVARTRSEWIDYCKWALNNRAAAQAMADRGRAAVTAYDPAVLEESVKQTIVNLASRSAQRAVG
ncbi:MAG: glycosyltransferase [Steroidobacteraceae bacterium]